MGQCTDLVINGGDISATFLVTRELADVTYKPLDNLEMTLPERCHKRGDFTVVLTVDVGLV